MEAIICEGVIQMKYNTTYDVVKKLIGKIKPVGETTEDNKRYENLEETIDLVESLISDLEEASHCKDRVEFSMKKIGKRAFESLQDIRYGISDPLRE